MAPGRRRRPIPALAAFASAVYSHRNSAAATLEDRRDPEAELLCTIAGVGIPVGVAVGAVQELNHVGVLQFPGTTAFAALHMYAGIFAGAGYAALFGLIARRISVRGGGSSRGSGSSRGGVLRLPGQALLALGRRSLSGYLAQSLVFGLLLPAWVLGFGAHLTSWSAGLLTWEQRGRWVHYSVVTEAFAELREFVELR